MVRPFTCLITVILEAQRYRTCYLKARRVEFGELKCAQGKSPEAESVGFGGLVWR